MFPAEVRTVDGEPIRLGSVVPRGYFSGTPLGKICSSWRGEVSDLGLVASVIGVRRYGWQFDDAVVARDGQVVFAEDDNLGHLWLYFPRIEDRREEPPLL